MNKNLSQQKNTRLFSFNYLSWFKDFINFYTIWCSGRFLSGVETNVYGMTECNQDYDLTLKVKNINWWAQWRKNVCEKRYLVITVTFEKLKVSLKNFTYWKTFSHKTKTNLVGTLPSMWSKNYV